MIYQYSVALGPNQEIIAALRELKEELRQVLKYKYHGYNFGGHVSLFDFLDEDGSKLHIMEDCLGGFCKDFSPKYVLFNRPGRMKTTYCIFPDDRSNNILTRALKHFYKRIPLARGLKIFPEHMSIGIQLSEAEIAIAQSTFDKRTFHYQFLSSGLVIRRRDSSSHNHYEIYREFKFTRNHNLLFPERD